MDEVVAAVDRVTDSLTDTTALEPWLAILHWEWKADVLGVSSHEWVPHAHLVEHHEKVVSGVAVEAWDVAASEGVAGIT